MPTICFVPGCRTGLRTERNRNKVTGTRNAHLFTAPRVRKFLRAQEKLKFISSLSSIFFDPQMLLLWQKSIPRKDKLIRSGDKLCELHFKEECIETVFRKELSDGSIHSVPRPKPVLKKGAIPTIFYNLPEHRLLKNVINKDELQCSCLSEKTNCQEKIIDLSNCANSEEQPTFTELLQRLNDVTRTNCEEKIVNLSNCVNNEELPTFSELLQHLKDVKKPSPWWTVTPTDEYIMCAKWDSNLACERRVAVCQNLKTKIFVKNVEISLNFEIGGSDSLSFLLEHVDSLRICENAESGASIGCRGYLATDRKLSICSVCKKFKQNQEENPPKKKRRKISTKTVENE